MCTQCGAVGHFSDELLAPVHEELAERQAFAVSQIQVTAFGSACDCQAVADAATSAGDQHPVQETLKEQQ